MSTIRCIYHPVDGLAHEPNFPPTAQHPEAARYLVGTYYVDAIGGEPTLDEIETVLQPEVQQRDPLADIDALKAALVKKNVLSDIEIKAEGAAVTAKAEG